MLPIAAVVYIHETKGLHPPFLAVYRLYSLAAILFLYITYLNSRYDQDSTVQYFGKHRYLLFTIRDPEFYLFIFLNNEKRPSSDGSCLFISVRTIF